MAELIKRDASIRVKIHPDTKTRLERLAHLFGVPPATLAAVWLGQMVTQQERSLSMVSKMADSLGAALREQLASQMSIFEAGAAEAKPEAQLAVPQTSAM